jgi:hypothetical protein
MSTSGHRLAEARSLALHREIALRLVAEGEVLAAARRRVDGWLASGAVARVWALRWADVLRRPTDEVVAVLTDPGETACDLRQVSPFAGAIDARRRWDILRDVRHRENQR